MAATCRHRLACTKATTEGSTGALAGNPTAELTDDNMRELVAEARFLRSTNTSGEAPRF